MAFNSDTYHANKAARQAYSELAWAKDIKRRAAAGEAYAWEIERIPRLVQQARLSMRISLTFRSCAKSKKDRRK